jgi:hypothetical protein
MDDVLEVTSRILMNVLCYQRVRKCGRACLNTPGFH